MVVPEIIMRGVHNLTIKKVILTVIIALSLAAIAHAEQTSI